MRGIVVLALIFFSVLRFAMALDQARTKRRTRYQQLEREYKAPSEKMDMFQMYSSKNKECDEHEAKQTISDPKPKKKWNLWNEPSWDDELK